MIEDDQTKGPPEGQDPVRDQSASPDVTPADDDRFYPALIGDVVQALKQEDRDQVVELIKDLHAADLADFLAFLTSKQRKSVISYLGDDIDPELFHEVEGVVQDDLYETTSNEQIASAVTELDTDDAVYVLEDMSEADRADVLEKLPSDDRMALEESLSYPQDSAGRMMQRDLVALPAFWTVGQTIDYLRDSEADLPEDFYDIFVVDPTHHLLGSVPLSRVLRTTRPVSLGDIVDTDVRTIDAFADQEEVAYQFNKYHLISAAVVDEAQRIVGVITVDDVIDVIEEEAEEDILALAGVGDASVNENFRETTKGRLTWLTVNLLTAILASVVIGLFDATIEQMVALAILMPIVASMGGNAGTQTMTVAVRAIATKELGASNAVRVMNRELAMAFLNGLTLSLFAGTVAWIWFGSVGLGIIFGLGMIINLLVAGLFGLMVPLGLNRAGIDPAIASSVFVTTITDVVGFFVFLGLAAVFLL